MISDASATAAVVTMKELMPFFPSDLNAQTFLVLSLQEMIETEEQLNWLVKTAVQVMTEWKGPAGLRALYCSRFTPMDGIVLPCDIPGYRPEDCEADHHRHVNEEIALKLAIWKLEAQEQLESAEPFLQELAELKRIPSPDPVTHECMMEPHPRFPDHYRRCTKCSKVELIHPIAIPATKKRTAAETEAELLELQKVIDQKRKP